MGTEREIDHRLPDLIRDGGPIRGWEGQSKWHAEAIWKHRWSRNIPLLWACGALSSKSVSRSKKSEIARWYDLYCKESFMAGEDGSRIYTRWIQIPNVASYLALEKAGHSKTAAALRLKIRANWAFLAAAGGWGHTVGQFKGHGLTCTNAGARSVCSGDRELKKGDGSAGKRWTRTPTGAAKAKPLIYQNGSYGMDGALAVALGHLPAARIVQSSWEGRMINAMVARYGAKAARCGLRPSEQRYLLSVVLNKTNDFGPLKEMLGAWLPLVEYRLMRFEGGTATIAEGWTNSSSTSASHGQTWNAKTKRAQTLYADDPRFRSRGRRGRGWVSEDRRKAFCVRIQDGKEIHYSHKKHDYIRGPASIDLPPGECTMDLHFTPQGVFDLLAGEAKAPAKPKPAGKSKPKPRPKPADKPRADRKNPTAKPPARRPARRATPPAVNPPPLDHLTPETPMPEPAVSPEETKTDWLELFLSGELRQRSEELRAEAEQWIDLLGRALEIVRGGEGLDLSGILSLARQAKGLRD